MNITIGVKLYLVLLAMASVMSYIMMKNDLNENKEISREKNKAVNLPNRNEEHRNVNVCDPIPINVMNKVKPDPNIRETTCNCCFPHSYNYLINNRNICKKTETGQDIDLFIMIFTQHHHVKERQAIRQTWLSIAKNNTSNVRYAFLLGKAKDDNLTDAVAEENNLYKDILKEDFIDNYRNLTIKTMMGFKWIVSYCRAAKYVLKCDDDMYVHIPNILKYIQNFGTELKTKMVGSCRQDEPIRYESSKWYASKQDYKERLYPPFCAGTGYLNSFTTIEKISRISPYIPFFSLEDIYVSLCLSKIGVTTKHVKGFNSGISNSDDPCLHKGDTVLTSHEIEPEKLKMIWTAKCHTA